MSMKPTLCGSNRINLPKSGCTDCAELEYRLQRVENWIKDFTSVSYSIEGNDNAVTLVGSDGSTSTATITAIVDCNE